ncbi:MAG: DUF2306 domain-containing protein [Bacteroidota bacterium]
MSSATGRNKFAWIVFAVSAVGIGLYPLMYFFTDREFGLLASKSQELLSDILWNAGFYGHILFGGIALLVGWTQFSKKWRTAYLNWHRTLGKVYVLSAFVSGTCAIYIGFYATGGFITAAGFISLGIIWLYTTFKAYMAIRNGDLKLHQGFMIYSYAACFAAVTLRIWLPFLSMGLGFITAYKIVAWLCWVPNMFFAYFWVKKRGLSIG